MNAASSSQALPRRSARERSPTVRRGCGGARTRSPRETERGESAERQQADIQELPRRCPSRSARCRGDDRDDSHADEDPARLKRQGLGGVLGGGAGHGPQADRRRDAEDRGERHRDEPKTFPNAVRSQPSTSGGSPSTWIAEANPSSTTAAMSSIVRMIREASDHGRSVHRCSSGGRLRPSVGSAVSTVKPYHRPRSTDRRRPCPSSIPIRAGADARRRDGSRIAATERRRSSPSSADGSCSDRRSCRQGSRSWNRSSRRRGSRCRSSRRRP